MRALSKVELPRPKLWFPLLVLQRYTEPIRNADPAKPAIPESMVHQRLISYLKPLFEPVFIYDSYANRKGKETNAAVGHLQGFMKQVNKSGKWQAYTLKLDIANFFNSINRRILFSMLQKHFFKVVRQGYNHDLTCALQSHCRALKEARLRLQLRGDIIAGQNWLIANRVLERTGSSKNSGDFVGGASAPIQHPESIAATKNGWFIYSNPISQPHSVPMGIFPDGIHQTGTHGIVDDVARNMPQIFPIADGMVVETGLPDRLSGCVVVLVGRFPIQRFVSPEQIGEVRADQLQQPMQVVWHQHVGKSVAQSCLITSVQLADCQPGQAKIGEQRQTILRHCGDKIEAADFRDTADAKVAAMREIGHGEHHACDSIAGKPAPTKTDGFVGGASAPNQHSRFSDCSEIFARVLPRLRHKLKAAGIPHVSVVDTGHPKSGHKRREQVGRSRYRGEMLPINFIRSHNSFSTP
jgi:hypothetical protein